MQSKLFFLFFRELFVRFWRQFVKFNLFDFDFESFLEMLEIESELFEEDENSRFGNKNNNYRRGVGVLKSVLRGGSKNDLDMKRNIKFGVNGKRNYSIDFQLIIRLERFVRNNRNYVIVVKVI